ncbi:MAG: hypothetical protein KAI50_02855 [Desulfobacterales bacterium]|nr:hypothetical protein [Desulfobacterales bacterium]
MIKIEKINIDEGWGYDYLYLILQDAFRVLHISYQKLYTEKQNKPYTRLANVKRWSLEDLITDDLIRDEEKLPKAFEYRIVNQQKDATKNTRIDIAVQWSLRYGHAYDIKIECKLLKRENLNYIIDGGLQKFKANKYAEKLPLAGMLTYNTFGVISENIKLLNEKIEEKISSSDVLNRFKIIEDYQYTYISSHQRLSNSNIKIYTMVFDFKDVIRNSEEIKSV